jgi:hypothetical protein
MRESLMYGSVRGARGNSRPYRDRRDIIALLGSTAATWPLVAGAQQPAKLPTIGFLNTQSLGVFAYLVAGFRRGLRETGYVEDRNVAVEYRWAENQYDRLPALAADLVRRQVAVIAATGAALPRWQPNQRPQRYRSSSSWATWTRSEPASSRASTDRAATLPV